MAVGTKNRISALSGPNGSAKIVVIEAPKFHTIKVKVIGTAPLVGNKFTARARAEMRAAQEAGSTAKKGKKREAKNFDKDYEQAIHKAVEGWEGIPAPAFRNAMISACKMCGFAMTRAKMSVFVEADGVDSDDGTPLVKITKGKAHKVEHFVRNKTGVCDLRPRPMWDIGWEAIVRIRFDGDQFTQGDVLNLLARAGLQVGICAGRPDSKDSNGMGWGTFGVSEA